MIMSDVEQRKEYYIIRYGNFATNGNIKIMYGMLSLCLGLGDYVTRGSMDCFTILIGSTSVWTIVEMQLHLSNTRVIKPMSIKIKECEYVVPLYISLIVQGLQEGGLITTLGLYFGDRLEENTSIIIFHVFLLFSLINVCAQKSLPISSRRMVNTNTSMGFIGLITVYDVYTLSTIDKENYYRQLRMLFVMIYFSAWWTCATWWIGSRGVETIDPNKKNIVIKSSMNTFMVLSYDVVFEIGFAYLLFYNMFIQ